MYYSIKDNRLDRRKILEHYLSLCSTFTVIMGEKPYVLLRRREICNIARQADGGTTTYYCGGEKNSKESLFLLYCWFGKRALHGRRECCLQQKSDWAFEWQRGALAAIIVQVVTASKCPHRTTGGGDREVRTRHINFTATTFQLTLGFKLESKYDKENTISKTFKMMTYHSKRYSKFSEDLLHLNISYRRVRENQFQSTCQSKLI